MDKTHDTAALEAHLTARGVRPTASRLLVLRTLWEARAPLSLRELEERLVVAERSTVFRSLQLLVEHHLAHAIDDGSGAMKYEACHGETDCTPSDQHPHFYCRRCRHTFCLTSSPLPQIALAEGFRAEAYNIIIKGLCPQCAYEEENSSAHRRRY